MASTSTTFEKNLYHEHEDVKARSAEDIVAFREKKKVNVEGNALPRPITTFEEASFPEYVLAELKKAGFPSPTAIQSQAWPIALQGRDLIGLAQTGSGKTLAFLLPAIVHINAQPYLETGDGPIALVLAPTRELAVQIQQECAKFATSSKVKSTCIYGGVPKGPQVRELRAGAEIVIATPGRLIDMIDSKVTNMQRVTYLVLDEADRMLDMGFEPQITNIVRQIKPERQTLLWSATWPSEVEAISAQLLRNPCKVTIGSLELQANHMIKQSFDFITEDGKYDQLCRLLEREMDGSRVLVFCETKRGCDEVTRKLRQEGWPALSIHGDKSQEERDWVLAEFKSNRHPVMLATDVAARGLDVKDIKCVINYDMAHSAEDYVHRIGRTGRAGATGSAYTFFTPANARLAKQLKGILEEAKQPVPAQLAKYALVTLGLPAGFRAAGQKWGV